jgi:hypothetical protein
MVHLMRRFSELPEVMAKTIHLMRTIPTRHSYALCVKQASVHALSMCGLLQRLTSRCAIFAQRAIVKTLMAVGRKPADNIRLVRLAGVPACVCRLLVAVRFAH